MSDKRSSQKTRFVKCIRTGDLEGVQNILRSWTGNLDTSSNPRLKELLKEKLNDHEETALHIAVKHQQESIVKWLLQYGADICVTDLYLRTVLHTACDENEGTNIISLILKYESVDVNAKEQNGITPVWLAAEKGNSSAVKLLMDNGADITIADKADNTSLHVAAKTGNPDVLELLLAKLVSNKGIIGKQNKDKETPLHLAVTSKNQDCVAMLLNAGAAFTMHIENEQGQTATDLAKEHGNKRIISLLEDPQKAKELFQAKPKPKPKPELGRYASVEPDSAANHTSNPVSPTGASELPSVPQNTATVQVINKLIVHQQFTTTIHDGCVAVGPGARVVNAQDATVVGPPRSLPCGDSQYNLNITGGNAAVGDNPVINLAPGTPGSTPNTAGSSSGPFFPEPQENSDTSSGFPTENPSSLRGTESATRPTEEHSPGDKLDQSARRPVQEGHPRDPSDVSTLSRSVQEECLMDKSHVSSTSPVQEESPKDEFKESLHHPVQEEHPSASLSRPVQEECHADKSYVSSTSPAQVQSPMGKSNASLPYAVSEGRSPRKLNGAANGANTEEPCTSRHPMSSQTRTDDDLSLASDCRFTGEAQLGSSFNGEPAVERMGPDKHTDAVRDSSSEKANAPSGAAEPCERSNTAMDPESCDKAGALKASKQNWQDDMRHRPPRTASSMTRGIPKVAQDRLLEATKSLTNETFSSDQLCGSSTCAPSPSGSKESSHRKAEHSRAESMTTARNGEASFPGNHCGDNPVGTSWDNLSSGTQSSADGPSTVIEIKDDNPDDDRKGHESCDDKCRLM